MRLNQSFWRGKTVFVTGHTGFKGSWLSLVLEMLGSRVIGYSLNPPTLPNLFDVLDLKSSVAEHHVADINDGAALARVVSRSKADIFIHMAAQSIVFGGYSDPVGTFRTNVMGTINFLEAFRKAGEGVALIVSSDKCYANQNQTSAFRESDPLGGLDPYSASKAGTELVTECWRSSFLGEKDGHSVASVRAGNVIGGGDWSPNRLLPDLAKAFANNSQAKIRNPSSIRPWQFVLEPVIAYLAICERLYADQKYARPWNVGPNPTFLYSVERIVRLAARHWPENSASWCIEKTDKTLKEAQSLRLDSSDFVEEFDWRWNLSIEETIEKTMKWFFDFYTKGGTSAQRTTKEQIEDYLCFAMSENSQL